MHHRSPLASALVLESLAGGCGASAGFFRCDLTPSKQRKGFTTPECLADTSHLRLQLRDPPSKPRIDVFGSSDMGPRVGQALQRQVNVCDAQPVEQAREQVLLDRTAGSGLYEPDRII